MIRYTVTPGPGGRGVNLSKPGQWGNMPYPTCEAAYQAAAKDAAPHGCAVEYAPCFPRGRHS